jgi:hypothetical protein
MKRILILSCLFFALIPIWANPTDSIEITDQCKPSEYVDSLSFLKDCELLSKLESAVWNREPLIVCKQIHEQIESITKCSSWENLCLLFKADTVLARYCIQGPSKEKDTAKKLLKDAGRLLAQIKRLADPSAISVIGALESDFYSVEYIISPILHLSKGIESTKLIDKAFKSYSNEVSVALMYANRRLYAPAIGGKDVEEAYSIFCKLANHQGLAEWDMFSIYSGIGMCLFEKQCYDESAVYLHKAMAIYHGDEVIAETISKLTH